MADLFKCWKTKVYGSCANCSGVHSGDCDYQKVFEKKDISSYNPCPICLHKKDKEKCQNCDYKRNKK